ncbi:bifunctional 2-polyprenyl-6-hydroxyphenol methylase/3-demethylubiquinol 3-O-methyltransferase UbiG [Methylonatrum kenyense]|uniref:bifunctional 2-polyprenyl-6-hydroxyphenol methylase/3-demethylubiquinol 3-O-methyltransferase UbiG n=1 Tax=Methylonatrum kenyense TaxID=455253 RepID=UPI0020BEEB63|nr:bifunctional 2-polyprenyl-6-hydroxyphenol methylase/3-demethylubiquinol 3-O-methyltransferase UbiG [Methylonatrum kenyense]MCK8515962.1 bifunctional 2-polyprenyl-6-hydroxyphenol methylase/3-demethylubiquinol 3-O-methyltransferase UbiG [Methylonatrum kenyense]
MTEPERVNASRDEIDKFDAVASRWWDQEGEFKPLHQINPLRLAFIREQVALAGCRVLDVGCGGGILSESLAREGARTTAIDLSPGAIEVARLHALESGLEIDYQLRSVESLVADHAGQYELVTCMELLEHVPDPASVVRACAQLVRPGGTVVFSTLNRNPKAYLLAIVAAEYLLRMLPRGTHDYARFIRPSELSRWAREADLQLAALRGIQYDPLARQFHANRDVSVNYMAAYQRAGGTDAP